MITRKELSFEDEIKELVENAKEEVRKFDLPEGLAFQALEGISQEAVKSPEQYDSLKKRIKESIRYAKFWSVIMDKMLAEVLAAENRRRKRELFSEKWRQDTEKALVDVFQANPKGGLQNWRRIYAEALLAQELDICQRLIKKFSSYLSAANLQMFELFQAGTQALQESKYEDALEMMSNLIGGTPEGEDEPVLDREKRAVLEIFVGRINHLRRQLPEEAWKHYENAKTLLPGNGQPYAAFANYYQTQGDPDQAAEWAQKAIDFSPDLPDGYVALGLWAQSQKNLYKAQEYFSQAVDTVWEEKDPFLTLTRLLAPFSGNLGLVLAQRLFEGEDFAPALKAVDAALSFGINGKEKYPEAVAYELKSYILEKLTKPDNEIANALYQAGWRYLYKKEPNKAKGLLTRAKDLYANLRRSDPKFTSSSLKDHLLTHCHLAEAWRSLSFKSDSEIDPYSIEKSKEIYDEGLTIGLPDAHDSWIYTLGALICDTLSTLAESDQRTLLWQSATYLERAIFLKADESYRWAYLGRCQRELKAESSALQATEMALEYGPKEPRVLDERAGILADVGEFTKALEVIDKRRNLAPHIWTDVVKAYILLRLKEQPRSRKEQYQDALVLLKNAVAAEPKNFWYWTVRAHCYRLLNDVEAAVTDYHFIWENHNPSDRDNQSYFSLASYYLGLIEENPGLIEESLKINLKMTDETFDVLTERGIIGLALGDFSSGEEEINKGLARASNIRQLSDLQNDIKFLETYMRKQDHGKTLGAIFKRLRKKISSLKSRLKKQPHSVEKELRKIVSQLQDRGEFDNWPWIGVHASLARFYTEKKRWSEAASIYKKLEKYHKEFPEARQGLEVASNHLRNG